MAGSILKLSDVKLALIDSENSDFGLNNLFNSNDGFDYNTDHSAKCNSVVESDHMNVQALGKISKNLSTQNMRIKTEIKQRIPYNYEYKTSVQSFEKPSVKVPSSKMSPFCITSEIESIINKIIFLRRCYISIETHRKVFVSKEFKSIQGKLIKEYQALLNEENLRLREILREKNEVKFEDITKLMRIVDTKACPSKMRIENLSVKQNIYENLRNKLPQPEETISAIKGDVNTVKYNPMHIRKHIKIPNVKSRKNYSYCRAIENTENNRDWTWGINGQSAKSKKAWERNALVLDNQVKPKLFSDTIRKTSEVAKQGGQRKGNVKIVDKINYDCSADPTESKIISPFRNYYRTFENTECNRKWNINGPLDSEKSKKVWEKNEFDPENKLKHELATLFPATIKRDKMLKQRQVARKTSKVRNQDKQRERNVKIVDKTNYDCGAHPKEPEKGNTKTAMIAGEINPKKIDEKMKKQEKKLRHNLKKLEAPKKSRFLSFMCPGGRVDKATRILDALCETCKLNLEMS